MSQENHVWQKMVPQRRDVKLVAASCIMLSLSKQLVANNGMV
jgi:hypothetical protein